MSAAEKYAFVIVGGGTAGAVLAARLSERSQRRVLLLEAGGQGKSPLLRIPAGYVETVQHPRFSWCFETAPVPTLGGRRLPCPRGKGLGGSSAINGMIWVRGQAADFDGWREAGNPGWGWQDLSRHFAATLCPSGEAAHDGLSDAFLAAALAHGLPPNAGFNGDEQEGAGYYHFNIAGGQRQSTAKTYLGPARRRDNLRVVTDAAVSGLLFEGRRAVGVRYERGGKPQLAHGEEIVLCAGAVGSPQLLLLSGIGPAGELQDLGVPRVHDLPGVGKNLQDHYLVRSSHEVRLPSLNRLRSKRARLSALAEWLLFRKGPLAAGPATVGAFFRTRPGLSRPDAQLHFIPCSFEVTKSGPQLHRFDGMTAAVYQLRPESRGAILRLASRAPGAAPLIAPMHLESWVDQQAVVAALRLQRALFENGALAAHRVRELEPGPEVADGDDQAWLDFARRTGESAHHLSGTCKMGPAHDAAAVVDASLRVHGIAGLRVADASIMPTIVSANTHAATIAIAERAAELFA